jgi:hypothetical protein
MDEVVCTHNFFRQKGTKPILQVTIPSPTTEHCNEFSANSNYGSQGGERLSDFYAPRNSLQHYFPPSFLKLGFASGQSLPPFAPIHKKKRGANMQLLYTLSFP